MAGGVEVDVRIEAPVAPRVHRLALFGEVVAVEGEFDDRQPVPGFDLLLPFLEEFGEGAVGRVDGATGPDSGRRGEEQGEGENKGTGRHGDRS